MPFIKAIGGSYFFQKKENENVNEEMFTYAVT
jgi:hypothetical protein